MQRRSKPVVSESEYQKQKRLQKAMTGQLDRLLRRYREQKQYAQIEAASFVWEDVFPQFAHNHKHRTIICEHYAFALNQQQRFQDVIAIFVTRQAALQQQLKELDSATQEPAVAYAQPVIMSQLLGESILLACGHLKESATALQLLRFMKHQGIRVTNVAYFHVITSLIKDERFSDFDLVLQLCEESVATLQEPVALSLQPTIITIAAESGNVRRAMELYHHPRDAPMCKFTEFRFEICLQTLWAQRFQDDALHVYDRLMLSKTASASLKERVSKWILGQSLKTDRNSRNDAMEATEHILATMDGHQIYANNHSMYPLLRALLQTEGAIDTVADLQGFFKQYPFVLGWNSFTICEAIIASIRCERVKMIDQLLAYALDQHIPIKYAALEAVVAFYFKLGMMTDLTMTADLVRALRLNKHIPLGIAMTEMGMSANLRLGRFQEVIHLFEDFAAMDGDRKRVLSRRIMLKSAHKAYAALDRIDEAHAMQRLLHQSYGNLLNGSQPWDEDEDMAHERLQQEAQREMPMDCDAAVDAYTKQEAHHDDGDAIDR